MDCLLWHDGMLCPLECSSDKTFLLSFFQETFFFTESTTVNSNSTNNPSKISVFVTKRSFNEFFNRFFSFSCTCYCHSYIKYIECSKCYFNHCSNHSYNLSTTSNFLVLFFFFMQSITTSLSSDSFTSNWSDFDISSNNNRIMKKRRKHENSRVFCSYMCVFNI